MYNSKFLILVYSSAVETKINKTTDSGVVDPTFTEDTHLSVSAKTFNQNGNQSSVQALIQNTHN